MALSPQCTTLGLASLNETTMVCAVAPRKNRKLPRSVSVLMAAQPNFIEIIPGWGAFRVCGGERDLWVGGALFSTTTACAAARKAGCTCVAEQSTRSHGRHAFARRSSGRRARSSSAAQRAGRAGRAC